MLHFTTHNVNNMVSFHVAKRKQGLGLIHSTAPQRISCRDSKLVFALYSPTQFAKINQKVADRSGCLETKFLFCKISMLRNSDS